MGRWLDSSIQERGQNREQGGGRVGMGTHRHRLITILETFWIGTARLRIPFCSRLGGLEVGGGMVDFRPHMQNEAVKVSMNFEKVIRGT